MRPAGLTLVELLVVISVTALLAALLFPAFHASREQARATACQANVWQLAFALQAYEGDNLSFPYGFGGPGKALPPAGYQGDATLDHMGWWWFDFIGVARYKSARGKNILRCPSRQIEDAQLKPDILCGNYGANRALCKSISNEPANEFEGDPLPISAVRHPAATLLVMDSGYSLICWWHVTEDPPVKLGNSLQDTAYVPGLEINKRKLLLPGQDRDAIFGRHPNKRVNIAFADHHVERVNASELLVEKMDDGNWDYKPLWSPD